MKYAIISTEKAREAGINPLFHRTNKAGNEIIVNENELLKLGKPLGLDNKSMAEQLGGDGLLSRKEMRQRLLRWNNNQ